MNSKGNDVVTRPEVGGCGVSKVDSGLRLRVLAGAVSLAILILLFAPTLVRVMYYAAHSDLDSHTLLAPFVTVWLLCIERRRRVSEYKPAIIGATALGGIGVAALIVAAAKRGTVSVNDELALKTLALVSLAAAIGFVVLGSKWMRSAAFPVAFLLFMIPLPDIAVDWLERASMLASAEAAAMFFSLTGTPVVRTGTVFELPRITLQVARECSGMRSSWVLLITSLIAAHIFLRTKVRKMLLVAFVIPLGIVRNGFRVLVIGLLCIHVGPHMIDSPIHHRGGPIFFGLSLLPFALVVWCLRRQELRSNPSN